MNKKKTYVAPATTVLAMESELLQSISSINVDGKKQGDVKDDDIGLGWGEND